MIKKILPVMAFGLLGACASSQDIFPSVDPTTLDSPTSLVADAVNNQLIVVNSNVDFLYDHGSLMTVSVDGNNADAPVLAITSTTITPNFAGQAVYDGAASLYVPFREGTDSNSQVDQLGKYTVGAASITETTLGSVGTDPFGLALSGGNLLVVSNDELNILNTSLVASTDIDLTTAETSITHAQSAAVENIAVDAGTNRAFITNRTGKILVVDLATNLLTHVIDGPDSSRGIATDGTYLYVVDGNPASLWIFNPAGLPASTATPQEVDDQDVLIAQVDLGLNPNGIALDVPRNRAYVANTTERSVSVIDTVLFAEIARVSLKNVDTQLAEGKDPFAITTGTFNGNDFVFVGNVDSNTLSVINADTLRVVGSFP